jgi:RNA polymerase sigma factor (sigma-70 family)
MARKRHLRSVGAAPTPDGLAAAVPTARTRESEEPTTNTGFIPLPSAEELEKLLDEESDEEFGQTETDIASSTKRAVLKEWSAADFANIYTRYRPHLERHARRWLRNQTQVDEVVQDAFLYLMVTLPELDSELGVLRFLKWKVKNLCIDVIRASNRAQFNSIDEVAEPESNDPEIGSELEHAEDAAIVRLALSKLNPRHREVLLASMYEEKSTREIAAQVGLSENATLQLIHRARAAFKKALLGDDVNTEGMSVQAILSVAARKAAADVKKAGAQAMIFIVFLAVAVGGFLNFNRPASVKPVAEAPSSNVSPSNPGSSTAGLEQPSEPASTSSAATASSGLVVSTVSNIKPIQSTDGSAPGTEEDGRIATISQADINALTSASTEAFFTRASSETNQPGVQSLYLHADNDISAKLDVTLGAQAIVKNLQATLLVGGNEYKAFFPSIELKRDFVDGNVQYTIVSQLKYLVDGENRVITGSLLNYQFLHIRIQMQNSSDVITASSISVGAEY